MCSSYFAISIKTSGTNHCFEEHLETSFWFNPVWLFERLTSSCELLLIFQGQFDLPFSDPCLPPFLLCLLYPHTTRFMETSDHRPFPFSVLLMHTCLPVHPCMQSRFMIHHYNHSLNKILISFVPPFSQGYLLHKTPNLVESNHLLSQSVWVVYLKFTIMILGLTLNQDHGTCNFHQKVHFPVLWDDSSYLLPASSSCPTLNLTCASQKIRSHQIETPFSSKQICETTYTYFHILSWFLLLVSGASSLLTSHYHSCIHHCSPLQQTLLLLPHFHQHRNMPLLSSI